MILSVQLLHTRLNLKTFLAGKSTPGSAWIVALPDVTAAGKNNEICGFSSPHPITF
jgi:hypothetical protein